MFEPINLNSCFFMFRYCWPFWPIMGYAFYKGRPVYSYAESGFAVDYTKVRLRITLFDLFSFLTLRTHKHTHNTRTRTCTHSEVIPAGTQVMTTVHQRLLKPLLRSCINVMRPLECTYYLVDLTDIMCDAIRLCF